MGLALDALINIGMNADNLKKVWATPKGRPLGGI